MEEWTIEIGAFRIPSGILGSHMFWVLRDSNYNIIAEIHGFSVGPSGLANTIGGPLNPLDTIQMFEINSSNISSAMLYEIFEGGDKFFSQSNRSTTSTAFSGSYDEVMARWGMVGPAIAILNEMGLSYGPATLIPGNFNSNSAAHFAGIIMGLGDVSRPMLSDISGNYSNGWNMDIQAKVINGIVNQMNSLMELQGGDLTAEQMQHFHNMLTVISGTEDFCFAAETEIAMWPLDLHQEENSGTSICENKIISKQYVKNINNISPGDIVVSYDIEGKLVPGSVVRTFQNKVSHLLDVHGLKVTPGHVSLCGDGRFSGRHVPLIDILISDGALVKEDGSLMRLSINKPVGSIDDHFVKVLYAITPEDARQGHLRDGEMRVGTLLFERDGLPVSVLDCLLAEGLYFDPETGLVCTEGEEPHPLYWFGELPRPEDYILRRSHETLEDILVDNEWEGSRSELIAGRLRKTARAFH